MCEYIIQYTRRNLIKYTEIRLYLPFSIDLEQQMDVRFLSQINRCIVNTI